MDGSPAPPLPQRPDFDVRPRGSCLVYAGVLVGLVLVMAFSVLMIGFVWPFVIGFSILGIIALQYVLWGWWMGRVYHSAAPEEAELAPHAFSLAALMLAITCFAIGCVFLPRIPWPGEPCYEPQQAIAGVVGALFGCGIGALRRSTVLGATIGGLLGLAYAVAMAALAQS